ncbi:MAG: efflux RND transporter periplasmic adaptor subunit [Bacteroidetes bacterium]|nr:efflux RND transporter periplasmic adaptor subunit [Bacteroidota bacterium]
MTIHRYYIFILLLVALTGCKGKEDNTEQAHTAAIAPIQIVALGRVEPLARITSIGCQTGGIIRKIYIAAGDSVRKGQTLIEIAHDYENALLQQAQARYATQSAEIDNVTAQLKSARIKSDNLRTRLQRIKNIYARDAETKQNLDNAQADLDQSLTDIDRYNSMLVSAQKTTEQSQADINVVKAQIAQKTVLAPADGVVLNMDLTEGAAVSPDRPLFDFAPASPLTVLCEVDELYFDKVKLGQKAYIRNQGMSERLAEAEVIFLSPYIKKKSLFSDDSSNMEDRRVREVRLQVRGDAILLFNSRVEVVISI